MESAPAHESMFVHGILHRIEGDYDNARAWYGDVADSDVFRSVWPDGAEDGGEENGLNSAREFISAVEAWTKRRQGAEEELRSRSGEEIRLVVDHCEKKFGIGRVDDASGVWISKEKTAEMAQKMVTGGEGWREF